MTPILHSIASDGFEAGSKLAACSFRYPRQSSITGCSGHGIEISPPVLIDHGILFSSSDRHTLDLLMINLDTRFTRSGGLERAFLSI